MSKQNKQKFAFSLGKAAQFRPGFRTYFQDRDLGVKQATGDALPRKSIAPAPPAPRRDPACTRTRSTSSSTMS